MVKKTGANRFCRRLFVVVAVIYVGIILYWGRFDMGRISREYDKAAARLQPGYALNLAQRQVADRCRKEVAAESGPLFEACLQAAEPGLNRRVQAITEDLAREKRQVIIKSFLFYSMMFLIMILLPVVAAYIGLRVFLFLLGSAQGDAE